MQTLATWTKSWIERRSIRLAPQTISGYKGNLRRYIEPSPVGQMFLDEIAPEDLIILLSPILAKGFERQAQLVQILVGAALKDAVRQRIIPWNPMDCVDKIRHRSKTTSWLTVEQAKKLLSTSRAAGDPFYPAWLLGLCCGLRRGEILGLQWADIDFQAGILHVCRQRLRIDGRMIECRPKSESSTRDIPLSAAVSDQLRFYRRFSPYVVDSTPDQLRSALDRALIAAELPRITLHGLRHSMAATAATDGIPIKVLQELMGHAQYSTTADVYAHIDRCAVIDAAFSIAARLEIA